MSDASIAVADRDRLGAHTRVTKRRPDGFILELVWRGLVLTWNGRLRHYGGERAGNRWSLTTTGFEQFGFRKPGQDPSLDEEQVKVHVFGAARWLAHCTNGGDGAERDRIEDALEASLEYALSYNRERINALLALSEEV